VREDLVRGPVPPRLLLLDMDGTLTTVLSPWQFVHERLGVWEPAGKELVRSFLASELGYVDFCNRDVELWNELGVTLEQVHEVLGQIPVPQCTVDFLRSAHEAGIAMAIVSSGFSATASRIMTLSGLPDQSVKIASNRLYKDSDGKVAVELIVGDDKEIPGKAHWSAKFMAACGVTREEVAAVGDTSADEPMFRASGRWAKVRGPEDLATLGWFPLRGKSA